MGGEYGYAVNDQRHRAVLNGIWDVGYGFQLSGLYFMGSGMRFSTTYGGDLRQMTAGGTEWPPSRMVPSFRGTPSWATRSTALDVRVQRRFGLGGSRVIDGIFEVYNVFNHENYGSYTTQESNARYGQPSDNQPGLPVAPAAVGVPLRVLTGVAIAPVLPQSTRPGDTRQQGNRAQCLGASVVRRW